jgi:hypothetical protein
MARRKAGDKKARDQGEEVQRVQADHGSTAIIALRSGRWLYETSTLFVGGFREIDAPSWICSEHDPSLKSGENMAKRLIFSRI